MYANSDFLNVIGWCNNVDECSNNCTCAPCSNLKATKYALLVAPTTTAAPTTKPTAIVTVPSLLSPTKPPTSAPSLSKVAPLLPDCPQVVKNSCSGSSTCSAPATGLPLSAGAIAGVVIAGLFFIVSSYVSLYWCFCRGKEKVPPSFHKYHHYCCCHYTYFCTDNNIWPRVHNRLRAGGRLRCKRSRPRNQIRFDAPINFFL